MVTPLEAAVAIERPKMNALGSLILFGQHFVTAQFHSMASFLIHVPRNVIFIQAGAIAGLVTVNYLPFFWQHILLRRSLLLLLEFS